MAESLPGGGDPAVGPGMPYLRLVDSSGNPMRSGAGAAPPSYGAGGGGQDAIIDIAGLKKNVGFLNWAVGIIFLSGLSAIIVSFLTLNDKIDNRFDRADDRSRQIEQKVEQVRLDAVEQKADVEAILERVSGDRPKPGDRTKPTR
jgi:hypothetical protein